MRKVVFYLTAALTLTSVSCGHNKIHPVSGKVTYNGIPAIGAAVFFHRRGGDALNDHLIMGIVQEDGSFDVVCGSLGEGAPPGDYDVVIEWKQVSSQAKRLPRRAADRLQGRYADPKHPLLHATVKAEPNHLPPFELTDTGALPTR